MRLIPIPDSITLEENQQKLVAWSNDPIHERPWEAIVNFGEQISVTAVVNLSEEDIERIAQGASQFTVTFLGPNVPEFGFGEMSWDEAKERV